MLVVNRRVNQGPRGHAEVLPRIGIIPERAPKRTPHSGVDFVSTGSVDADQHRRDCGVTDRRQGWLTAGLKGIIPSRCATGGPTYSPLAGRFAMLCG